MKNYKKLLIQKDKTIKEILKAIDQGAKRIVFVINENNELLGAVTDGDVRRWILQNGNLDDSVVNVLNDNPKFVREDYSSQEIEEILRKYSINVVPVVNSQNEVIDIVTWEDLFEEKKTVEFKQIELPVVIMAGGKGTRMAPFTRILPKPLIPIGNRAMIEVIMDEYAKFGMKQFYISINHMGKMIRAYFEDHESDYSFDYITENKPLGTVGALKYLEDKIDSPFFVSNCDIIIKDDYTKIYDFHKDGNYALTMVASMQHHTIPYGVCEIENGGELKSITEKPQYDFLVNTGMYLLKPEVLKFIPESEFFHITHLIEEIKLNDMKIGVYPVSEQSYIDVGQWEEYKKSLKIIGDFNV